MKIILILIFFSGVIVMLHPALAQAQDKKIIKNIFDDVLINSQSYQNLAYLSNNIGGRLSGSPQAAEAVEWSKKLMEEYGFDKVFLQEVMVPHWVRGKKEVGRILFNDRESREVNVVALGNSIGTGERGVTGSVIEVITLEELPLLGREVIEGKIVFFNRPFDPTLISTFDGYSGAVDQRVYGPSEAAKLGAIGAVVRSMTPLYDDFPHTGSLVYKEGIPKIPAIAISTNDAEVLSQKLKENESIEFSFETHSKMLEDVLSYNVVGELTGTEYPDEYILVGAHLDSWDNGDGAHDCGAGSVQSIEVLRIFQRIDYQPKRSIRAVLFMNEENGLRGGTKYAQLAVENNEDHIAAIESDRGGFLPIGFTVEASNEVLKALQNWKPLFEPYQVHQIKKGYSGADIRPLKPQGTALFGFLPDSQRYFNLHHTDQDSFDKVNKRELELGAATMAALVFLIDKYGLPESGGVDQELTGSH